MDISISNKYDDNFVAAPLPPKDVLSSVWTCKIRSAIHKQPRSGPVPVGVTGVAGDEQEYGPHGGREKALHQYSAGHYAAWNAELPGRAHPFQPGGFGQNLSTSLLHEENVCIGDRFRIGPEGGVEVVVGEPRQPYFKLNHRFAHGQLQAVRAGSCARRQLERWFGIFT